MPISHADRANLADAFLGFTVIVWVGWFVAGIQRPEHHDFAANGAGEPVLHLAARAASDQATTFGDPTSQPQPARYSAAGSDYPDRDGAHQTSASARDAARNQFGGLLRSALCLVGIAGFFTVYSTLGRDHRGRSDVLTLTERTTSAGALAFGVLLLSESIEIACIVGGITIAVSVWVVSGA